MVVEHIELWGAIVSLWFFVLELRFRMLRKFESLEKKITELYEVVTIKKTAKLKD